MVCGGVWWFAVVCGGLWWFVVICGGLAFTFLLVIPIIMMVRLMMCVAGNYLTIYFCKFGWL